MSAVEGSERLENILDENMCTKLHTYLFKNRVRVIKVRRPFVCRKEKM